MRCGLVHDFTQTFLRFPILEIWLSCLSSSIGPSSLSSFSRVRVLRLSLLFPINIAYPMDPVVFLVDVSYPVVFNHCHLASIFNFLPPTKKKWNEIINGWLYNIMYDNISSDIFSFFITSPTVGEKLQEENWAFIFFLFSFLLFTSAVSVDSHFRNVNSISSSRHVLSLFLSSRLV